MSYSYSFALVEGKPSTYKITWEKDGVELISTEMTVTGTIEGIEAALRFAAEDLREANPDLFVPDFDEMHSDNMDMEELTEDAVN